MEEIESYSSLKSNEVMLEYGYVERNFMTILLCY